MCIKNMRLYCFYSIKERDQVCIKLHLKLVALPLFFLFPQISFIIQDIPDSFRIQKETVDNSGQDLAEHISPDTFGMNIRLIKIRKALFFRKAEFITQIIFCRTFEIGKDLGWTIAADALRRFKILQKKFGSCFKMRILIR